MPNPGGILEENFKVTFDETGLRSKVTIDEFPQDFFS